VNCRYNFRRELGLENFPAVARNAKRWAEDSLRRRRTHAHEQIRPNDS